MFKWDGTRSLTREEQMITSEGALTFKTEAGRSLCQKGLRIRHWRGARSIGQKELFIITLKTAQISKSAGTRYFKPDLHNKCQITETTKAEPDRYPVKEGRTEERTGPQGIINHTINTENQTAFWATRDSDKPPSSCSTNFSSVSQRTLTISSALFLNQTPMFPNLESENYNKLLICVET